jgi:hypothetical protein
VKFHHKKCRGNDKSGYELIVPVSLSQFAILFLQLPGGMVCAVALSDDSCEIQPVLGY